MSHSSSAATPASPGLARRTLNNAAWSLVAFIWPALLYLGTTPFLVQRLGSDAYGLLSLVTAFIGILAFLDLGFSSAAIKYLAQAFATRDWPEMSRVYTATVLLYLGIGLCGCLILAGLSGPLAYTWLGLPARLQGEAQAAFILAGFGFWANMVLGAVSAVARAIQRYDIYNGIVLISVTLTLGGAVVVLLLGGHVLAIVLLNLGVSLLSIAAYVLLLPRLVPGLGYRASRDPRLYRRIFSFSSYVFLSQASATVMFNADKTLVGFFLGASSVTYYTIPANVGTRLHGAIASLTNVTFPLSSELSARGERERLQELYVRSSKYALIVTALLAVPLIVLAPAILRLWVGEEIAQRSGLLLSILVFSYAIAAASTVPYYMLNGIGRPEINAWFVLASGLLNLVSALILIPLLGRWGLGLLGAAVASIMGWLQTPFLARALERRIGLSPWLMLRRVYGPILIASLGAALVAWLLRGWITGLWSLGVSVGAIGAVYLLFFWGLGFFDDTDRRILRNYLKRVL